MTRQSNKLPNVFSRQDLILDDSKPLNQPDTFSKKGYDDISQDIQHLIISFDSYFKTEHFSYKNLCSQMTSLKLLIAEISQMRW